MPSLLKGCHPFEFVAENCSGLGYAVGAGAFGVVVGVPVFGGGSLGGVLYVKQVGADVAAHLFFEGQAGALDSFVTGGFGGFVVGVGGGVFQAEDEEHAGNGAADFTQASHTAAQGCGNFQECFGVHLIQIGISHNDRLGTVVAGFEVGYGLLGAGGNVYGVHALVLFAAVVSVFV